VTAKFCPRGAAAQAAKQVICYILSYTSSDTAVDVTTRYLPTRSLPSKTKGFRVPITSVPIYTYSGEVVGHQRIDWFGKVLRSLKKPSHLLTPFEQREERDLNTVTVEDETGRKNRKKEDSITAYKNHSDFVLARHLKREEALSPDAEVVKTFTITSKGEKLTETVYRREDVLVCKTSENWYRDGRKIVEGAQPLKLVSRRAVTLARKREIESTKQDSGETPTQGLYALYQTEIYRPPPVGKDDTIPKNEFNNIDLYTPSMLPEGTVHLPLKGAARVAKQLGVEYAEAVTGFEFRKQRANPVIEGVVVRTSDAGLLEDAWRTMEEERRRKEQAKKEGRALEMWTRWVRKLRVRERLRRMWAEEGREEENNPFIAEEREDRHGGENGDDGTLEGRRLLPDDYDEGGGFLPEDRRHSSGGFILDLEEGHIPATGAMATTVLRPAMSLRELAQQSAQASVLEDEDDEDAADNCEADEEEDEASKYFSRAPKTRKRKASLPTTVRATRSSARRRI
jgi:xeroderma pigmentosum group C-complementing protein